MLIISDIDGVIADVTNRLSLLRQNPIDWDSVNAKIPFDRPVVGTIEMLRALAARGHLVHLFTGRAESTRDETEIWLQKWRVPYNDLIMRPDDDFSPNYALKRIWIRRYTPQRILFALDDSPTVITIYRQLGLLAMQVRTVDATPIYS